MIKRRKTHAVNVGGILVGGQNPVRVQSMTNTDTADIASTVTQIKELSDAGSEVVRITVNNEESAAAVPEIISGLRSMGYETPIVGDFHYNGHTLLEQFPDCAKMLAKYRINPGNVGFGAKQDSQFAAIIEQAIKHDKPVRIGVNWGSLDQKLLAKMMDENGILPEPLEAGEVYKNALVKSALDSAMQAEAIGLPSDKIVISCKVSKVQDLVQVYRDLASKCEYPLHLGLTEAGMGEKGIVASTAALAILLQEGIGDTIRISLTPKPNEPRTQEVLVAQEILQSLDIRHFTPQVTACPGCGRTTSTFFQELAETTTNYLRKQMPIWAKKYPGVEQMDVAVMGCIVNGPGESKHANIGISLPGTGEQPSAPVFEDGKKTTTLKGDNIAGQFIDMIDSYVEKTYSS